MSSEYKNIRNAIIKTDKFISVNKVTVSNSETHLLKIQSIFNDNIDHELNDSDDSDDSDYNSSDDDTYNKLKKNSRKQKAILVKSTGKK